MSTDWLVMVVVCPVRLRVWPVREVVVPGIMLPMLVGEEPAVLMLVFPCRLVTPVTWAMPTT
jgi:hypothetical protein